MRRVRIEPLSALPRQHDVRRKKRELLRRVGQGDVRIAERPRQGLGHLLRVLKAPVGVALERFCEPLVERDGQIGTDLRGDRDRLGGDRGERHGDALIGVPDGPPDQALERHASERPQIGAVIDVALPLHLLGGHVRRRSEHRALAGEARGFFVRGDGRVELCEAEIEELGELVALLASHQENVLGLQIAVNDACRVGLHQALRAVGNHAHRGLGIDEPDARHPVVQRLALQQLHRDERTPILEPAGVVDVDDVRALHARCRAGFPKKALDDHG